MNKSQIPNPKSQTIHKSQFLNSKLSVCNLWFVICNLFVIWCLVLGILPLFAQDNLETLKDKYFSEHKYADFTDYLKQARKKNPKVEAETSYYIALTRYNQLKYLEESQNWDEYFSSGNDYRDELVAQASNTVNLTSPQDSLNLYAHCLLWQFHKDQQDVFAEDALKALMSSVEEYAGKKEDLRPIKYIADKLYSYGNKSESKKLYGIYADKLLKTETKEGELKKAAEETFALGNISLSTIIYDSYINKIVKAYPKEKSLPILLTIAKSFSYKDEGRSDADYAEKIFKKIEEIAGASSALDEEASYIRAYNLEKAKVYPGSRDKYTTLINRFPDSTHYEEALYKCGIITAYILKDIDRGSEFFAKLAKNPTISSYVISSIYQLGLLSQWRKDFPKAKEYYSRLMELTANGFGDTRKLTQERLKELEKDGEIEYNLKTFLGASLKENFDMSKIDLKASPYKVLKDKDTKISANTPFPESGCMNVEVTYLWSGHLGTSSTPANQPEFTTSYQYTGTKEINLVVMTPSGILEESIDMADVE